MVQFIKNNIYRKSIQVLVQSTNQQQSQQMQLDQSSQVNMTSSYMGSSIFSDASDLLGSKLSNSEMEKMKKQSLLCKLLQLYQALEITERDNQLLRIQKAQLRTQLKVCKSQAMAFIQQNIHNVQQRFSIEQNQQNYKVIRQSNLNSPGLNYFTTPCGSQQELGTKANNKVFIKTHHRGVSNLIGQQEKQAYYEKKRAYYTSVNSPQAVSPPKFSIYEGPQQHRGKSFKKLTFEKSQLETLSLAHKEEQQKEGRQKQQRYEQRGGKGQVLESFQSFNCRSRQDLGQTQRIGLVANSAQKKKDPFLEWNQKWKKQNEITARGMEQRNYQKGINRSMSSSNLLKQKTAQEKGFKIPSSIDEIWGSTSGQTNSHSIFQRVNMANSKLSKISKVNSSKAGVPRKSYLNS